MSDGLLSEAAEFALRKLERSQEFHDTKLKRIKEQQLAYEGLASPYADSMQWESQLRPPILNHSIETAMTMLVDDEIDFDVKPAPRHYEADEWKAALAGAEAHEDLLKQQMIEDYFDEFLRPFILTAAINRVAVAKTGWRKETFSTKSLAPKKLAPLFGPLSPVRLREQKTEHVIFDGPETTLVDLRDFYWQEAAISLDNSDWCAHAHWMTMDQIRRRAERAGWNQEALKELIGAYGIDGNGDRQLSDDASDIERLREERGRKNGRIEVLELWDRSTRTLYVIGARRTLLAQVDWPYWHGDYPFVAMSLAPFPFSIQGLSLVEKLAPMQDAYWNFLNQSVDNMRLVNNAVILMASDYDNAEDFEWAPGAVNIVDNPQQVQVMRPDANIAQIAQPIMAQLQSDMQNLAMGQPLSIPMSGRVTATEIATLSQIAQNAASKMKDQVTYALRRIGRQRMRLNQQYIRRPTYFHSKGADGALNVKEVTPDVYQGEFQFVINPSAESQVRAERRSEKQALLTMAIQAAPVFAQVGVPLNMRAFMDEYLKANDVENTDMFYSAKPQAPAQAQGTGSPVPPVGEGAGPGGQKVGMTGPNSIAPEVSPSNQASISPGMMLQRALALQGGAQNGGNH